jgi:hypothetical protein
MDRPIHRASSRGDDWHDLFRFLQNAADRIAGLSPLGYPMFGAFHIDCEIVRGFLGIVRPDVLDKPAIARAMPIGDNDPVNRDIFGSDPA